MPHYDGKSSGAADTLAKCVGGPGIALCRLEIDESRDIARYAQQLKELGDEPSIAILHHVIEDEQEHYRELSSLIRDHYPASAVAEADRKSLLEELGGTRSAVSGPVAARCRYRSR